MEKIFLDREHIEILTHAAQNTLRPVLSSLYIMPDRVVCSDSYRLLEVTKTRTEHAPTLIDRESLAVTRKQINKKTMFTCLEVDGADVNVTVVNPGANGTPTNTTTKALTTLGVFPNYAQIMPTGKPLAWVKLNASYLRELAAYAEKYGADDHSDIFLELYGEEKPAQITFTTEHGHKARGILMPLRPSPSDIAEREKREETKVVEVVPEKEPVKQEETKEPVAAGVSVHDLPF